MNDENLVYPILPSSSPSEWPSQRPLFFLPYIVGTTTHEFVVLKTAKAAGDLVAQGAAEAPEKGAVGEIPELKPGAVKRLTLSLRKGHYSLICNLAGHYSNGQFVDFYVRG